MYWFENCVHNSNQTLRNEYLCAFSGRQGIWINIYCCLFLQKALVFSNNYNFNSFEYSIAITQIRIKINDCFSM